MKKMTIIGGALILTSILPLSAGAATNKDSNQNPTPNTAYCGHGSYGYNAFAASSTFQKKQIINFCLQDDTRTPLFIGGDEHPWKVVNEKGKVVFTPTSISPTSQPPASYTFFDSWDGKNNNGKYVKAGTYTIVFNYPNNPSVTVTIEKDKKSQK